MTDIPPFESSKLSLDEPLPLPAPPMDGDDFDQLIEDFITKSGHCDSHDKIVDALAIFYQEYGKFFPEDIFYEQRMNYFWDLYIFCSPAFKVNATPYYEDAHLNLKNVIDGFEYSLFRVHSIKKDHLILFDEINKKKIRVEPRPLQSFAAMSRSDYLHGLLYLKDNKYYLSHGMIMHPQNTKKQLMQTIKQRNLSEPNGKLEFLAQLSLIQMRHTRHLHVPANRIYAELLQF